MYRILLADDEGIVLNALEFIIQKNFGGKYELETAKTGLGAIEAAERFRPDIVFMDIQMPGINGIDAMREIRKFSANAIFVVLTAYDKFDYAKEAISHQERAAQKRPADQGTHGNGYADHRKRVYLLHSAAGEVRRGY